MNSAPFLKSLREYQGRFPEEMETVSRFESLVSTHPDCFERTCLPGHLTASALIVSPTPNFKILFTLHRKLGLWLQLGGHADGDSDLEAVAMKEAEEESGLTRLEFAPGPRLTDIDIHRIPGRPGEPEHLHYDARYVIYADEREPLQISAESKDLRWFTFAEALEVTQEPSLHRLINKAKKY